MNFVKPSNEGYTIYSKSGCPFCDKAKILLTDEIVSVINCDPYLINEFLEFIKELTEKDHKSFPIIFRDAKFIGGYSDLLNYLKEDWSKN